jgi:hypothetical protein
MLRDIIAILDWVTVDNCSEFTRHELTVTDESSAVIIADDSRRPLADDIKTRFRVSRHDYLNRRSAGNQSCNCWWRKKFQWPAIRRSGRRLLSCFVQPIFTPPFVVGQSSGVLLMYPWTGPGTATVRLYRRRRFARARKSGVTCLTSLAADELMTAKWTNCPHRRRTLSEPAKNDTGSLYTWSTPRLTAGPAAHYRLISAPSYFASCRPPEDNDVSAGRLLADIIRRLSGGEQHEGDQNKIGA